MTTTTSSWTASTSSGAGRGGWSPSAVVVVGAGIAGLACARTLHDAGAEVVVLDRGRRPGGRLGARSAGRGTPVERVVDVGASYLVPRDTAFRALAESWRSRGLAGPWTDTFLSLSTAADGAVTNQEKSGPMRWSAPGGLHSLADDLADALVADDVPVTRHDVRRVEVDPDGAVTVDGAACRAVVLAMPEPQAARLAGPVLAEQLAPLRSRPWEPVIAVWARWDDRWWPDMDGAFVQGSPAVAFVADDGRRRGDGAAVLVAHTPGALARDHLGDPDAACEPVLAELGRLLGRGRAPVPVETGTQRWTFARPREAHPEPSWQSGDVAVCGDAWGGRPGVEQAWLSGCAAGARTAAATLGA